MNSQKQYISIEFNHNQGSDSYFRIFIQLDNNKEMIRKFLKLNCNNKSMKIHKQIFNEEWINQLCEYVSVTYLYDVEQYIKLSGNFNIPKHIKSEKQLWNDCLEYAKDPDWSQISEKVEYLNVLNLHDKTYTSDQYMDLITSL